MAQFGADGLPSFHTDRKNRRVEDAHLSGSLAIVLASVPNCGPNSVRAIVTTDLPLLVSEPLTPNFSLKVCLMDSLILNFKNFGFV